MSGRSKNSWKLLSDARLECRAKEFIKTELELALTFVKVAQTKYSMGNVADGDFSHKNAEKAYREALNYFGKLSDFTSLERWKLMDLVNQVKTAIATLPKKPANTPIGHYVAAGSRNHITWTLQPLTLECSKAIPLPCCPDHSEIFSMPLESMGTGQNRGTLGT